MQISHSLVRPHRQFLLARLCQAQGPAEQLQGLASTCRRKEKEGKEERALQQLVEYWPLRPCLRAELPGPSKSAVEATVGALSSEAPYSGRPWLASVQTRTAPGC